MNVIINYQAGNLNNLKNALDYQGIKNKIVTHADEVRQADRILLPGVGAFAPTMESLRTSGMMEAILEKIHSGTPFLGICVGLQLLFSEGHEFKVHQGLGIIKGKVIRLGMVQRSDLPHSGNQLAHKLKIPQIGWNQVSYTQKNLSGDVPSDSNPLFKNISNHSYFYFVHSYFGVPTQSDVTLATTDYGEAFPSAVHTENVWGVQFHPEKSQEVGLQLLKNFCSF